MGRSWMLLFALASRARSNRPRPCLHLAASHNFHLVAFRRVRRILANAPKPLEQAKYVVSSALALRR
jgi:hypothetical protein